MMRPVPAVIVSTMMSSVATESSRRMFVQAGFPNRVCGFCAKVMSVEDWSTASAIVR